MLISGILGIVRLSGNPTHKGAETVNGRNERSLRQAPAEEKKKLKTGWIVLAVVVLVAAEFFLLRKKGGNTQAVLASDTQVLEYADLESSISATGTVESSDTTKVYSTLASPDQERAGRGW